MMGFRCLGFLKVSFMVVVVAFLICFVSKYLDFFFQIQVGGRSIVCSDVQQNVVSVSDFCCLV